MRLTNIFFLTMVVFSCTSASEEIEKQAVLARSKGGEPIAVPDGMAVFRKNCITCHGADGRLGLNGAKDLTASKLSLNERIHIITNGKNLMTPFKALLTEAEIKAVAEYTTSFGAQSDR
jgi:mono/diheme cytochrome c family protein